MEDKFRQMRQYIYYILIFVISFLVLVFLPMIGTDLDMGFKFPETPAAWIVFIVTKSITAFVNVMLFYCFNQQALLNVKNDERYKKANEILCRQNIKKEYKPRSPSRYNFGLYAGKGTSIFISSILSTFALSQAILTYDWISLLTYTLVIIFGIIFGFISMYSGMDYWTIEFPLYAEMMQRENEEKEKSDNDNHRRQSIEELGRAGTEQSTAD